MPHFIDHIRRPFVLLPLLAAMCAAPGALADVDLGSAAGYAILSGNSDTTTLTSLTLSNNATVGVGTYTGSSSPDTFSGWSKGSTGNSSYSFVDGGFGSSCTSSGGTCTPYSVSTPSHTTVTATQNESMINAALADAMAEYNAVTTQSANTALGAVNITSAAGSDLLTYTGGGVILYSISSLSLSGGGCLILDNGGHSDETFVFNVTGSFSIGQNGCIKSQAGETVNAIFNVEGTGTSQTVSIVGSSSKTAKMMATLVVENANVNISHANITGQIIAGFNNVGNGGYTISASNSTINYSGFTRATGRVPEPATLGLFGTGAALLAAFRRARSKRTAY